MVAAPLSCPLPRPASGGERAAPLRGVKLAALSEHAVASACLLQSWVLATWAYFPSETGSVLRARTTNGSLVPPLKYGPQGPAGAGAYSGNCHTVNMELAVEPFGAGETWV